MQHFPRSKSRCENGSARRRLCVVVRRRWTQTHRQSSQIQILSDRHGNTWIRRFRCEKLSVVNRVFGVRADQTGQYLDIEPDLRHAPLIISESGCNTNTEAVSTPREKLQDKLVLDGRRSPILKKDEVTRYRSACMKLSYLVQNRLDLAETTKHLAQRMSEPREFDFVPLKRAARYLVEKPKAALRFRRQEHADKITVFVDSDFAGDPVSRKSTAGLVAQIGNHTVKSGSTLQSLTALSVGEAEFYAGVKGCQDGLSLRSENQ